MADQHKLALGDAGEPTPAIPPPEQRVWPVGFDRGICSGCRQPVFWASMVDALGELKRRPTDGSVVRNPINPWPVENGNLQIVAPGRVGMIPRGVYVAPQQRWTSHFATCPTAPQFRRRGRGRRSR
jgi:hypothetical protein